MYFPLESDRVKASEISQCSNDHDCDLVKSFLVWLAQSKTYFLVYPAGSSFSMLLFGKCLIE